MLIVFLLTVISGKLPLKPVGVHWLAEGNIFIQVYMTNVCQPKFQFKPIL